MDEGLLLLRLPSDIAVVVVAIIVAAVIGCVSCVCVCVANYCHCSLLLSGTTILTTITFGVCTFSTDFDLITFLLLLVVGCAM